MISDPATNHEYPNEYELLKLNLERIDAAVNGEYEENDRRLNWFLLFQAFLFQGYATALQTLKEDNLSNFALHQSYLLIAVILLVGLVTSVFTLISTKAGIIATNLLKEDREKAYKELTSKYKITTAGWFSLNNPLHHKGLLPTKCGPMVIVVAWLLVSIYAAIDAPWGKLCTGLS